MALQYKANMTRTIKNLISASLCVDMLYWISNSATIMYMLFQGAVLRGWIDLTSARDSAVKKSVKFFDEALQG